METPFNYEENLENFDERKCLKIILGNFWKILKQVFGENFQEFQKIFEK